MVKRVGYAEAEMQESSNPRGRSCRHIPGFGHCGTIVLVVSDTHDSVLVIYNYVCDCWVL